MAEPEKVDATLVTSLLECAICLEPYNNPVVLPGCLHSFCCNCLEDHVNVTKDRNGQFRCPTCRKTYVVPKDGVQSFPRNFLVNKLKDIVPASVLQELESLDVAPIQCKHSRQGGAGRHGVATVFCTQCDADLCENCAESHSVFDLFKDHNVVPVRGKASKKVPNCGRHPNHKVDWFCNNCQLPACSDCILKDHKTHDTQELSVVADIFKEDLHDVTTLAAKRTASLQKIARDLDSNEHQMEEQLDQASHDIDELKQSMVELIELHAATLQSKVTKAREGAREHMRKAKEELKISQDTTSSLESCAQTLCAAQAQFTFRTAVQAPSIKQQFLLQQQVSVPSVQWKITQGNCDSGPLSTTSFMGAAEMMTPAEEQKKGVEVVNGNIGEPIKTTKLQYAGNKMICGIAIIHKTLLCVAHDDDDGVWVYTSEGELKQKVEFPGVDKLFGMVALDGNNGKLAIVDGKQSKVHIVVLSPLLEVNSQTPKDVPFAASRLSMSSKGELVVAPWNVKRCAVLTADGVLLRDIQLNIPGDDVKIRHVIQTQSGYIVVDKSNKKVHFTDANGGLLHTSSHCKDPLRALPTTWGHVLVVDFSGDKITVFSEEGVLLGDVQDSDGNITYPQYIHIDEAERLLYIGCGEIGHNEVRKCKFAASDLPALPVKRTVRKMDMSLKLATVSPDDLLCGE